MPDLEVLFYPIVLTSIFIGLVIRHFRNKKKAKQLKKVMPFANSPPPEFGENHESDYHDSDAPLGV